MDKKVEEFLEYVKANVVPVMVDFIEGEDIKGATVLNASIGVQELNGHYEEENYLPPRWLEDLKKEESRKVLVIDKIDSINKEEQLKFKEILKYKKVSTFEIPDECLIIVTAKKINKETIEEEILSLVAKI